MFSIFVKTLQKRIKQVNKLLFMCFCFVLCAPIAFADFSTLGGQVKTQLNSAATTIMDVLNTVVASVGIVYVCILAFVYIFKPETFKENTKLLIGALIVLGVLYGFTKLGIRAFGN